MSRPNGWNCQGGRNTYIEWFHKWYNWGMGSPYNLDHVQMSKQGTESLHDVVVAMPSGGQYLIFNEPQLAEIPAATAANLYFTRYNEVKAVDASALVGGIGLLFKPEWANSYLSSFLARLKYRNDHKKVEQKKAIFDFYAIHAYYIGDNGMAGPLDGGKISCGKLQAHLTWLHGALHNSYPTIIPTDVPVWITETAPLDHLWCLDSQDVVNTFMQPLIDWLDNWGFDGGKVQKVFWFIAYYFPNTYDQVEPVGNWKNQQHLHYQCAFAGVNHVMNPSFDANINGWTPNNGQSQLSQQNDGLLVHDPVLGLNNCLRIKGVNQAIWTGCYQHIRGLEAGRTYKIYRWYKTSHGYSHVNVGLTPIAHELYQGYHTPSDTWKRAEGQFTVPANRDDVWLTLLNSPVLNDYVKYDSVVIFEVSGWGPHTELWYDEVKNLVANPYFGENIDGWAKERGVVASIEDGDKGFLGGNCLKLQNTQADWGYVWTAVSVKPGHRYKFNFRHKNGSNSAIARVGVGPLHWDYYDSGWLGSGVWEYKDSGHFVPTQATIYVTLVLSPDASAYRYFDSVCLHED